MTFARNLDGIFYQQAKKGLDSAFKADYYYRLNGAPRACRNFVRRGHTDFVSLLKITSMLEHAPSRDRDICKLLETNASELEGILGKSRQTISKYIEDNKLFGVDEVIAVATKKFTNNIDRSRVVSRIISEYFRHVLKYTRDVNVERFSSYCITGMHIYPEIVDNPIFAQFVTNILSVEETFVLFVCLPQKQYVQLSRWLERFKEQKVGKTASFLVLPCRLVELAPIQVLADPWSDQPKLIQFNRDELFVDEANSKRAAQLASALREYGLSADTCDSIQSEAVARRLVQSLNSSFYDGGIPTETPLFWPGSRND